MDDSESEGVEEDDDSCDLDTHVMYFFSSGSISATSCSSTGMWKYVLAEIMAEFKSLLRAIVYAPVKSAYENMTGGLATA